ncbi:unnamed protein product [Menidia menidia]|uniref:(Atlantic silverside) hypothetical protein n=1 Tax=Menidia menidia TaxID=238744 RepID=A0A8S4AGJ9_9TELE|nr:unnamed protein product [Menidia menidia]
MSRLWRYLAIGLAIAGGLVTAEADQNITAQPGEDVTLKCQDGNEKKIAVLEWSRTDLDPDHVLFFREGLFESKYQHTSFKNRVDLLDSQMKDGDVSLILKNVTVDDTGRYECRVMQREVDQGTNNMELICTLHLEVASGSKDGGDEDGRDDDGGDEDGGDEDGGDEDGRDKDGGDEDGRDKDGGTSVRQRPALFLLPIFLLAILCVGALRYMRLAGGRHPPPPEPAAVPQVEAPLMMDPPGPPAEAETPV